MAEEIKLDETAVVETAAPADAPAPKKRGVKKVASDATMAEASVAAASKRGRKRKETSIEVKAASQATPAVKARANAVTKGPGKRTTSKPSAAAFVPVLDEIAGLLQLEEENARLRKALADKLRTENADLRKRLGLS
ncbi:SyrB-like regulator [Ensifer adhaerens]|jgi:putative transposase|uniref:SyrB-like regulator n=1 Tax=Ensifer adhaerens TaxID=106592 RepID=UPI0009632219|nr:SyrB-like regulator [Ensifer adhaerens]OKP74495.1 hypothetical protein BTE77_21465 [Ensifer adhaerens]